MMALPHCDDLFALYVARWYPEDALRQRRVKGPLPDMVERESFVGKTPAEVTLLTEEGCRDAQRRIDVMTEAARGDWPTYLEVPESDDINLAWIRAFDRFYDRPQIQDLLDRSDPDDFSNDYLVIACEFGAALGYVLRGLMPHLAWIHDEPYWDSTLFDSVTGNCVPVFHWSFKKLSEYGVDDGLDEKVEACAQFLEERRQKSAG